MTEDKQDQVTGQSNSGSGNSIAAGGNMTVRIGGGTQLAIGFVVIAAIFLYMTVGAAHEAKAGGEGVAVREDKFERSVNSRLDKSDLYEAQVAYWLRDAAFNCKRAGIALPPLPK